MSVLTQIRKAPYDIAYFVRSVPTRLRNWSLNRQLERSLDAGPTLDVRTKQQELAEFYVKYESLVELLCDSAQYGPEAHLESRYSELRDWMLKNYPPVRQFIIAFLEHDVADAESGLDINGQPSDAFQALYSAPTLAYQIQSDDGHMISRIMRTREALNRYAEYLRKLSA